MTNNHQSKFHDFIPKIDALSKAPRALLDCKSCASSLLNYNLKNDSSTHLMDRSHLADVSYRR